MFNNIEIKNHKKPKDVKKIYQQTLSKLDLRVDRTFFHFRRDEILHR